MTEHERSDEAQPRGPLSGPERVGRRLGVSLFWLLAVAFVVASTRSVVLQVFGGASTFVADRSATCEAAIHQVAVKTANADGDSASSTATPGNTAWDTLLAQVTQACGDDDPTVQELTAVVLRMQKRIARNAVASEHEQARLSGVLQRYLDTTPHHQE